MAPGPKVAILFLLVVAGQWAFALFLPVRSGPYFFNMNYMIKRALDMALDRIDKQMNFEVNMTNTGQDAPKSSQMFAVALLSAPTNEARLEGRKSMIFLEFIKAVLETTFLTVNEVHKIDPGQHDKLRPFCVVMLSCVTTMRFQKFDGSCNNIEQPTWGQANTALARLLAPSYEDGSQEPRRSSSGKALPNARSISAKLISSLDRPLLYFTTWMTQWGQWVAHGLSHIPTATISDFIPVPCCSEDGKFLDPSSLHSQCMPIPISTDDPVYSHFGRTCMSYMRSMPAPRTNCKLGPVEQLNQVTSFLDGSQIYGSSLTTALELRAFHGGLLKASFVGNREFLPLTTDASQCSTNVCFLAGDLRVNYQPQLTLNHWLWFREHNRVARTLAAINPLWDDEEIFYQSRRIVIAELQHITLNHWLPKILGADTVDAMSIACRSEDSYCNTYDPSVNPTVTNEFGAAAAFFVENYVQNTIEYYNEQYQLYKHTSLSNVYNNPGGLLDKPKDVEGLIRGLLFQVIQNYDNFASEEVTSKLFRGTQASGMDRIALTIQRGRDHGLGSYNNYRELCHIGRAIVFSDLVNEIPSMIVERLEHIYESVDDIDLFVGGFVEHPVGGALLGPTFACILADQFTRTVRGDRFFYTLGDQPHSFTLHQLQQLRNASLARVICDNTEGSVSLIQPDVFKVPVGVNTRVSCHGIPHMDLNAWRELMPNQ